MTSEINFVLISLKISRYIFEGEVCFAKS